MFAKTLKLFRKDYLSITLGIKLVVFVIFLRSLGWGFVDPYWSVYLQQFTEHYTMVGLLTSVMSFSALLAVIPLMRLTDKMKEGTIIKDGELLYFFVVIAYFVAGVFQSLPLLILALFFNGIAQTFVVVGTEAYIRKHNGDGKAGPFGYYVALDYLGWIVGMLLAAFLVPYYNLNNMFFFVMPGILMSLVVLPRLHERGIKSLFRGFRRYFHSRKDVLSIFQDCRDLNPKMIFFFILAFFDGALRMFVFVFIPLFGLSINLSFQAIALLMAVMYMPFVFSWFLSELTDQMHKMNVIATGLFISAVSFISLFFIVQEAWVMVLAASISLSMAIVRPAYNGAITRLTPRRMFGEITGVNNFVERLGRIVGPILTGVIADVYGIQITFLLIAVIAFGLGAMSLIFRSYDLTLNSSE